MKAQLVNKPAEPETPSLIEGYTVIGAYITTCYHADEKDPNRIENSNLVSDGNQMAIVARNNDDASKYIIRRATTTGEKIQDYNVNSVDETAIFSFITIDEEMKPAYLDVIRDKKNKANAWGYYNISNKSQLFGVDDWTVLTLRLNDPVIEVGKVQNGYISINGLKLK